MEPKNPQKKYDFIKSLTQMPRKIINAHHRPNLSEFVLHDIASQPALNLAKAGFFVDNPDFDHLKGVTGYHATQAFENPSLIWDHPERFSQHMERAPFNMQVRSFIRNSSKKNGSHAQDIVTIIADELEFKDPQFFTWDMKHDNHGLFVFDTDNKDINVHADDLKEALYLLSLCPIF